MKKINIIQFLPYFPPHKGGLETHAQQRAKRRIKKGYGNITNITSDIGQENLIQKLKTNPRSYNPIFTKNEKVIGYEYDGYTTYIVPSFEFIPTFVCYKFRSPEYKLIKKLISPGSNRQHLLSPGSIVITRTRFFLTSLSGGIFAKKNKLKRVHIEHGSDYVKLNSKIKDLIARTYDQIIGNIIFKRSDQVIGISQGAKKFAKKFTKKQITVIHRGIDFSPKQNCHTKPVEHMTAHSKKTINLAFIGRLVKLKGVDLLLKTIKELTTEGITNFKLSIIGDGEEKENLEKLSKKLKIEKYIDFLGFKDKTYLEQLLTVTDITINPSYQEGLPTSVIESLVSGCVAVATDVGGTNEISNLDDLILCDKGNVESLKKGLEFAMENYEKLRGLSRELVLGRFNWGRNIEEYYKNI